jgi:hypothetical protein
MNGRCKSLVEVPGLGEIQCDRGLGHPDEHVARRQGIAYGWPQHPAQGLAEGLAESIARMFQVPADVAFARTFQSDSTTDPAPRLPSLEDAVEAQLEAIHDELPDDWHGHLEVEPVPPELTDTYGVAFGSAVKNCDHSRSSHGTLHSRGERQCDDCGRYFIRRSWFE